MKLKPFEIVIIIVFTLLFAYDYFPRTSLTGTIPQGILIPIILGLLLFSLLYKKTKNINSKEILKWQIALTVYILFLMSLFTILGGESSTGLSFDNELVWIVILFSLFQIYNQWKKVKKSET
ncbi:hypothetical protein G4D63_06310 [Bacillus mesophilus]|uniref:Permease n=2 Tax=Bacillus mesophilus TaxID=1808955 RepID=A0A6M0Q536_9BACI|nr:hypothetical protein [Bacillus mesophilus]